MPELPQKAAIRQLDGVLKECFPSGVYRGTEDSNQKNIKLYAVYESDTTFTVALCKNDGTVYKTENVASGSSYTLPSVRNASGYTFMGWDIQLGKKHSTAL